MSKNVLLASVSPSTIARLSDFSEARHALVALNAFYKVVESGNETRIGLETLKKRFESGEKFTISCPCLVLGNNTGGRRLVSNLVECNSLIESYKGQFAAKKSDMMKVIRTCYTSFIPSGLYTAYVYGAKVGNYDSTGELCKSFTNKHGGTTTITTLVNRSFNDYIGELLVSMGVVGATDRKAVRKFALAISTLIGAKAGSIAKGNYIDTLSENAFNELFMRSVCQRFIDKGVLAKVDGGRLVKVEKTIAKTA